MTIPGWDQWNTDYNKFMDGADQFDKDYRKYGDDQTAYKANVEAFTQFIKAHTPEEALLYFFSWIATATQPHKHDNILGLYDDQTTNFGDQMSGNARNTALANDIQNLMNDTTSGVTEGNQVKFANTALDQLLDKFGGGTTPDGKPIPGDPKVEALFKNTKDSIITQLKDYKSTIDKYFTWTDDHGQKQGKGTLTSFKDMIDKMGKKGDPDKAVEANKAFTDTGSILTSVTQNFSAALNQQVSEVTGMVKNWQSFLGSLMKSLLDETNSLIQNLSKG
jgi:hypothetical protein